MFINQLNVAFLSLKALVETCFACKGNAYDVLTNSDPNVKGEGQDITKHWQKWSFGAITPFRCTSYELLIAKKKLMKKKLKYKNIKIQEKIVVWEA